MVSRLLPFSVSERSAAIQLSIWHNLKMCGRYRLSRRKQVVEDILRKEVLVVENDVEERTVNL
jgi:hypothetical protein